MAKMDLAHIFCLIGGIIAVVEAVLALINLNWLAIVGLLLGLVAIAATGLIKLPISIPFNGIVLLILGIVMCFVATWIGGICVIIAAVLAFLGK